MKYKLIYSFGRDSDEPMCVWSQVACIIIITKSLQFAKNQFHFEFAACFSNILIAVIVGTKTLLCSSYAGFVVTPGGTK